MYKNASSIVCIYPGLVFENSTGVSKVFLKKVKILGKMKKYNN